MKVHLPTCTTLRRSRRNRRYLRARKRLRQAGRRVRAAENIMTPEFVFGVRELYAAQHAVDQIRAG